MGNFPGRRHYKGKKFPQSRGFKNLRELLSGISDEEYRRESAAGTGILEGKNEICNVDCMRELFMKQ